MTARNQAKVFFAANLCVRRVLCLANQGSSLAQMEAMRRMAQDRMLSGQKSNAARRPTNFGALSIPALYVRFGRQVKICWDPQLSLRQRMPLANIWTPPASP